MAGLPAEKLDQYFTWSEYVTWRDDDRWELIRGVPYAMSPGPGYRHQRILMELAGTFHAAFKGRRCEPLAAPLDVRLAEDTVVQPDLMVVCNDRQKRPTHIEGAPALVVEIISPTTAVHDRARKLGLYAEHGVQEYWIITPYPSVVEVLVLAGATYRVHSALGKADTLSSPTFPELTFPLTDVFDFPIAPEERVLEVRESVPPYPAKEGG